MQPNRFKTIHIIFLIVSILFAFSLGFISGNYLGLSSRTSIVDHLQKGINENQLKSLNQVWDVIHDPVHRSTG